MGERESVFPKLGWGENERGTKSGEEYGMNHMSHFLSLYILTPVQKKFGPTFFA